MRSPGPRRAFGALLSCLAVHGAASCAGERQTTSTAGPSGTSAPATTGVGGQGGASTSSGATGEGAGTPLPTPTPPDCACLAAVGDEACRTCLEEAGVDGCASELEACQDDGQPYCGLVLDCLDLCPVADAWCVDTCLGSQDEVRARVEAFAGCACGACATACGSGACPP